MKLLPTYISIHQAILDAYILMYIQCMYILMCRATWDHKTHVSSQDPPSMQHYIGSMCVTFQEDLNYFGRLSEDRFQKSPPQCYVELQMCQSDPACSKNLDPWMRKRRNSRSHCT